MADIRIERLREDEKAWVFEVVVEEDGSSTTHSVTLHKEDFNRMSTRGGSSSGRKSSSPEELVRKSFEFLLEREPKESILREFNLMDIGRYFPEYESEVGRAHASNSGRK